MVPTEEHRFAEAERLWASAMQEERLRYTSISVAMREVQSFAFDPLSF